MPKPDYSRTTYETWIRETERAIDAEMRAYWRLVEINGSEISRHERLRSADRFVRRLETYRSRMYHAQASQGAALTASRPTP